MILKYTMTASHSTSLRDGIDNVLETQNQET